MFKRPDTKINITDLEKSFLRFDAITFANKTRERLGISLYDPIDIIKIVEEDGILVFQIKKLGCSGFVRVFDGQKAIFVNASESLGRQHYTIAHEYCHILRDLPNYSKVKELSADEQEYQMNRMEYFAFNFADYFLMPEPAIYHSLKQFNIYNYDEIKIQDVLRIQQHFGVSFRQTIRMLKKSLVISDIQHDYFKKLSTKEDPKRLILLTTEAGFSIDLATELENSRIPEKFMEGIISNIRNKRLTHRKVKHLESLLGIPLMEYLPERGYEEENE